MTTTNKMFLIEKGKYVIIRDGDKEVGFSSFTEFNKYYPGLDISAKVYVDYEPDRQKYIEGTTFMNPFFQVEAYDNVIAALDDILAKKSDPYFSKTLEEAKLVKKQRVKQSFVARIREGCLTSLGFRFDCDDVDRLNIMSAFLKMQILNSPSIVFIDYGNAPRILTFEQMVLVGMEVGEYFQSLLYLKNEKYSDIDLQTTIEDVKLIGDL